MPPTGLVHVIYLIINIYIYIYIERERERERESERVREETIIQGKMSTSKCLQYQ
jgi:hypothetical protein